MTKPAKPQPDWEKIEVEYRCGLSSVREIAAKHGVSHPAILKRAKREEWPRDLSAKIKAKAEALLVTTETVTTEVTAETKADEKAVVDANAAAIVRVRLAHRTDIARARDLAMKLLTELEQTAEATPLIERLEALVASDVGADEKARAQRTAALQKMLELPTRTATMKALAETMTKLIGLEREAYSLETAKDDDRGDAHDDLKRLLASIDGAGTGLPQHAIAAG